MSINEQRLEEIRSRLGRGEFGGLQDDVAFLLSVIDDEDSKCKYKFEVRRDVFLHWAKVFDRRRCRFRANDKRDRVIKLALSRWTPEELKTSIDGYAEDPWRQGVPVRHELATLLRNCVQIEGGLELYERRDIIAAARNVEEARRRQPGNQTVGYGDKDRGSEHPLPGRTTRRRGVQGGAEDFTKGFPF